MYKYICDKCGQIIFSAEKSIILSKKCIICQGMLILEAEIQRREEIQKNIEEDTADDDMSPKQDAEEAISEFLVFAMEKNIKEVGNDRTFLFCEEQTKANIRLRYRYYFILAGGFVPEGQAITI
jgi:phage FluMu protein Com